MVKNSFILGLFLSMGMACHAQFGPQQVITTDAALAKMVFAADIDGDGAIDVLSASSSDDKIAWHKNTDGKGSFGTQNVIGLLDNVGSVHAADLDGDTDMDIMGTSGSDDLVVWYENLDGQGSFGSQQIIANNANGAFFVIAADLDNDADIDVLSASQIDNKIAWYENLTILDVPAINASKAIIYPNPVHDTLYVDIPNEDITQIELYNLSGKKVQSNLNNTNQIKVTNLAAGAYLLKIYTETGVIVKKIVKK